MKKILLVILVLSCLTWFSMFGFASTRTCTCGQNQPISNSIPTVEQPTVTPSTPSSSGSGGGVTSSSRPLIGYSLLTITRLSFLEGKYRVDGVTDLPVGTRLVVTITVHSSTPVTLKRKIEVRKGVFTAFFTPSSQVPAGTTDFLVEAVCNPRQQSDGVGSLFDLNGENLVGPKVEKLGKVRIMKASQYMILE